MLDMAPGENMIRALHQDLRDNKVDCQIVSGVKFSLKEHRRKKHTGQRDILLISLADQNIEAQAEIQAIFDVHRSQSVTFPIKEKSKHLMVRFQGHIFNFGYFPTRWFSKFRVLPSKLPSKATIESTVPLAPKECLKLARYIENIRAGKRRTIGPFDNEGYQYTRGTLTDNRPKKRGHNCTSWVATAPIGEQNEALMELLGADRSQLVGTNPGWWAAWALSSAERDISAIYWDHQPLDQMIKTRIEDDGYFHWDFKRM